MTGFEKYYRILPIEAAVGLIGSHNDVLKKHCANRGWNTMPILD